MYNLQYVDSEYFGRAMSYYRDKYGTDTRVVFVVVTDDMDWAVNNIGMGIDDVLFLGNAAVTQKVLGIWWGHDSRLSSMCIS